jgi:hypothetical protein
MRNRGEHKVRAYAPRSRAASSSEKDLREIRMFLKRMNPSKRSETRLHRYYSNFERIIKYIGLPSLLIASILPVYNIYKSSVDGLNEDYLRST